jgi:hypothetical protein
MSRVIKRSDNKVNNTLKKGTIAIGNNITNYGPTTQTGFYNGIRIPDDGYVVYKSHLNGELAAYSATSNAELLIILNHLGANSSTHQNAINWASQQNDVLVINKNYNNIITNNLLLNLDASQLNSYPGENLVFYDISGAVNRALDLPNGLTFNQNGWLNLDGSDDYVILTNNSEDFRFQYSDQFTVEALVKINDNTGIGYLINNRAIDSNNTLYTGWAIIQENDVLIHIVGGYPSNLYRWRNVNITNTNYNNLIYQKWAHIVWVNTGVAGEQKIYINGVDRTNQAYDDSGQLPYVINYNNDHRLSIGRDNFGNGGSYMNVDISTIRVYNTALSLDNILQNYYQSKIVATNLEFFINASNLVSYSNPNTSVRSLINNYIGSLVNSVIFNKNSGGYWITNGSSSNITTDYLLQAPSNTNTQTLCTWVKGSNGNIFGSDADTSGDFELNLQYGTSTSITFGVSHYGGGSPTTDQSNTVNVTPGVWNYVVIVKKSQYTYDVYYNGIRVITSAIKGAVNNSNLRLGSINSTGYREQQCSMVYAYNRVLTDSEIMLNFINQSTQFI